MIKVKYNANVCPIILEQFCQNIKDGWRSLDNIPECLVQFVVEKLEKEGWRF